ISRIPGVDRAIGRLIESTQIGYHGFQDFSYASSVPDGKDRKEIERIANIELAHGRLLKDGDMNKVVLGIDYLDPETLGKPVQIRDSVTVHGKSFEVIGILAKKGSFIIDNAIQMNEAVMRELFDVNDTYDVIVAIVPNPADMARVKVRVEDYLRKERDVEKGGEDFSVESPEQALANLDSTLFAIQIFVYVIAGISIIVGGIGIANTMYTSVVERTKQIGIMKAIGAQRKMIFTLFLLESGFLGFVGGIVGILFGAGIAYGLAFLGSTFLGSDLIQVSLNWFIVLGALLFSFVIGTVAGLLPAVQASRLVPVEALRYVK
ncbi:MAG: ABC transporter permease, partial [Candidatus Woesearchaeota archaeon]|nr:ABC transporter permease [Candidatus Woesearchaeota archaeon]